MNSYFKVIFILTTFCSSSRIFGQDMRLFPNYDTILYYHLEFSEKEINTSSDEELKLKFANYGGYLVTVGLNGVIPENVDSVFSHNGFSRTGVNEKQCNLIDSVFVQKPMPGEIWLAEYITPYYRDYFIFIKDEKVIGIIQIASNSSYFRLIGNVLEPEGFGENFEIGKFLSAFQKIR